ncbi:hypothetical protein IWW48_000773 [Coemansia sp. RSA 1200]|nr:hypothetical protein IWW48_000773 [Coemansia sp. RSA 1200]
MDFTSTYNLGGRLTNRSKSASGNGHSSSRRSSVSSIDEGSLRPSGIDTLTTRIHAPVDTEITGGTGTTLMRSSTAVVSAEAEASYSTFGAPQTERERMLWGALARSQAEIHQLQSRIHSLLDINIRYAEQLQSAITSERPRKRSKTTHQHFSEQSQQRTIGDVPLYHGQYRQGSSVAQQTREDVIDACDTRADAIRQQLQLQQQQHQQQHQQQQHNRFLPGRAVTSMLELIPDTQGNQDSRLAANDGGRNQNNDNPLNVILSSPDSLYPPAPTTVSIAADVPVLGTVVQTSSPVQDALGAHDTVYGITRPRNTSPHPLYAASNALIADVNISPVDRIQRNRGSHKGFGDYSQGQNTMPLVTAMPPLAASVSSALPSANRKAKNPRLSAPKSGGAVAGNNIGGNLGKAKKEHQARNTDIGSVTVGDPEEIPSIGRFESARTLYRFKERVREFEQTHGSQWREKMDSRRRQNWSRISAVYNRIVQLRGPSTDAADVDRAIRRIEGEMAESKVTLTRYSQQVRKRLNDERRQSLRQSQQQQQQQQQRVQKQEHHQHNIEGGGARKNS